MMLTHKELKTRALERADVKTEYDRLEEEFSLLDEFLKARSSAGMSQAEVAERMGTTQSAVARLESGKGKHSPSLATLRKYAHALGYRIDLRLVKEKEKAKSECRTLIRPPSVNRCSSPSTKIPSFRPAVDCPDNPTHCQRFRLRFKAGAFLRFRTKHL
jgi:transcriptional regulator with XRE-family HTH domain